MKIIPKPNSNYWMIWVNDIPHDTNCYVVSLVKNCIWKNMDNLMLETYDTTKLKIMDMINDKT